MNIPSQGNDWSIRRYVLKAAEEGDHLLKGCPGYDLIQPCLDKITGKDTVLNVVARLERPEGTASTTSNQFKKICFEFVAAMTDIKPFWEIRSYNKRYQHTADILSKLSSWWYSFANVDQTGLADCIRWASIAGTGYVHMYWDPRPDRMNIFVRSPDPRDVLPIRPVPNGSIQDALGVVIREPLPLHTVEEMYPEFADRITADRDTTEGGMLDGSRAGRLLTELSSVLRSPIGDALFGGKPKAVSPKQPQVDVFTLYIKDFSLNDGPDEIIVGDAMDDPSWKPEEGGLIDKLFPQKAPKIPANNWSYTVKPGERMYERGRMIVCTRDLVLYDGPNLYWHGKFPITKLTIDPFPTTYLGVAPMWDVLSLQHSYDWNLRVIDDHNAQVAQPGVIGDSMSVGPAKLKAINTRKAGYKILQNPMGKGMQIMSPPPLDPLIFQYVNWIKSEMKDLVGVVDTDQLSSLQQMPTSESLERIIESKSFLIQGRSRVIEAFMREFADQLMYNFAQFYTTKMRFTILGPDGITPEDFDFDPNSFIPDFTHAEDFDEMGDISMDALTRGPLPRYNRAKELMRHMTYNIAPTSLLNAANVQKKMFYLQLSRMGMIDMWTLAEILDIPNMGEPPNGEVSIPDRLKAQMMIMGGPPGAPGGGGPPGGGPGQPPTAQVPPHFEKGGATIAESK